MEDDLYIEFITNDPRNRGYFIPLGRLKAFINANLNSVMYHSYYAFDRDVLDHQSKYGTLKGFNGTKYPFRTILDIDAKDDVPKAAATTLEIIEYLSQYGELSDNNIQTWFSGSKGFHIHLPNIFGFEPSENLHASVKATLAEVFDPWESEIDLMPVMSTGIIRTPWSAHGSGYYKVPVRRSTISAIADEREPLKDTLSRIATAEKWRDQFDIIEDPLDEDDNGKLSHLFVEREAPKNHHQLNDMDKPNSVVTCMQKLLFRGPLRGRRHKDSLRLVSNWRRQGIPATFAGMMLIEWLDLDPNSSEAEEFRRIVRDVYSQKYAYSCKDEVMAEYCDSKCIFFKNKDYIMEVSDNQSMMSNYQNYLDKIGTNEIDLKAAFDFEGSYKILPGDLMIITGDTGVGKSAFIQTLLEAVAQPTLYLNLEMHEALIYRRFLQIEYQMTKEEINHHVRDGADFSEALPWLNILSTSPDVNDLDRLISQKEYKYVVVDTSDGITAEKAGNNEYVKLGMIINTLREIAQSRNIIIILIHHIKKTGQYRSQITLNDLVGNRANVTKMDHVFVMEGSERQKILRSLKARDEAKLELPFKFKYETMTYKQNYDYEQSESVSQSSPGTLRVGES